MRGIWIFAAAVGFIGHTPGIAHAHDAAQCATVAPPPAEFAPWSDATPLTAATTPATAQNTVLPVGTARKLTLAFASTVQNAAPPERPDPGAGKAGMVAFDVARAGTYRVGLSAGAWVEVVRDGKTTKSIGHGHGPECSGIRKIVDFELSPGRYLLQLTASSTAEVTAMVAPAAPRAEAP